jgi:hypothetical protein
VADSEDVQFRVQKDYSPRQAPLRAGLQYYFQRDSAASPGAPDPDTDRGNPIQVIVWNDWKGPQRAARLYYRHTDSILEEFRDGSFGYVVSSYRESWAQSPVLRYLTRGTSEAGTDIPIEQGDENSRIFGRYRPAKFRIARHLYHNRTAQDNNAQGPPETQDTGYSRVRNKWSKPKFNVRAANKYLWHLSPEDSSDASFDYYINAYQDWRVQPWMPGLYWQTSEEVPEVTPETPVDPSKIEGRYHPSKHKLGRYLYYQNTAQDIDATPPPPNEGPGESVVQVRWPKPKHNLKALRNYIFGASAEDSSDSSFDFYINAYQDWQVKAWVPGLYWHMSEDPPTIDPEIPADPSDIIGRFKPTKYAIPRQYFYQDVSEVEEAEPDPDEGQAGYYIWNQPTYSQPKYRSMPRFLSESEANFQTTETHTAGTVGWTLVKAEDSLTFDADTTMAVDFVADSGPTVDFNLIYTQEP